MISNPGFDAILGQERPAEGVVTELYHLQSSPAFPEAIGIYAKVYTIYCHNLDFQSGTQDLISLWLVPSGETLSDKHCLLNNYPANNTENVLKVEIVLTQGSKLFVRSSKGISSFSAFGKIYPYSYNESALYDTIIGLLKKVKDGTASEAEKEKLLYMQGGCKTTVINNITVPGP